MEFCLCTCSPSTSECDPGNVEEPDASEDDKEVFRLSTDLARQARRDGCAIRLVLSNVTVLLFSF